jgi:DNA-binding FadR family transcriptional regulator
MAARSRTSAEGRIRVPKTAELIAGRLRRQIIRGEIKAGEALLPETELMRELGVSRPTLREAFRILESESLISITRGSRGGARVHPPDIRMAAHYAGLFLQYEQATLEDVQAAREFLMPHSARMLAERQDPAASKALRELIAQEHGVADDPHAYAELSTRFYELMAELAGNKTLSLVVGMLHDIVETHADRVLEAHFDKKAIRVGMRSQEKLVELIEAGDADAAEAHWREHVRKAGRAILAATGAKTVVDLFD